MRNIKITVEYNGTHFSGWQRQPKTRTVQGEIEQALKIIFKKHIHLQGSGRTDAGVHAAAQIANFKTDSLMKPEEIVRALNGNLDDDISVLSAEEVHKNFHSQYNVKRKTYRYTIFHRLTRPALNRDFAHHVQYKINVSAMRKEAKSLIGKHDFISFTAKDPAVKEIITAKDTTRTIYDLKIIRKSQYFIFIEITANGFLYKMVRNIVGTLLKVGAGNIPPGSIKNILKAKCRDAAGETAPAKGLMLMNVVY